MCSCIQKTVYEVLKKIVPLKSNTEQELLFRIWAKAKISVRSLAASFLETVSFASLSEADAFHNLSLFFIRISGGRKMLSVNKVRIKVRDRFIDRISFCSSSVSSVDIIGYTLKFFRQMLLGVILLCESCFHEPLTCVCYIQSLLQVCPFNRRILLQQANPFPCQCC